MMENGRVLLFLLDLFGGGGPIPGIPITLIRCTKLATFPDFSLLCRFSSFGSASFLTSYREQKLTRSA